MKSVRAKLAEGGRIVIPAEYRKALGLKVGEDVILQFAEAEHEVRMFTPHEAVRRFQETLRHYIPEDRDLVAELIAERRAEAQRE